MTNGAQASGRPGRGAARRSSGPVSGPACCRMVCGLLALGATAALTAGAAAALTMAEPAGVLRTAAPGGPGAAGLPEAWELPDVQEFQDVPEPPVRRIHPEAVEAISGIRSPFCPGLMLEVCPSPDADVLRDSIDARARAGMDADAIIEAVIAAHGEEYRAIPRATGTGLLAWVMPPAAILLGLGVVVAVLRRMRDPEEAEAGAELTAEDRARLDAALAEMEALDEAELREERG